MNYGTALFILAFWKTNLCIFRHCTSLLRPACLFTITLQVTDNIHDFPLQQWRSTYSKTKSSVNW